MSADVLRQALDSIRKLTELLEAQVEQAERSQPDALLTQAEVAERMRVSRTFVSEEIRSGRLPAQRYGKRCWRVRVRDLDAYDRARSQKRRTA